jgi:hypothetical protein
MNEYEAIRLRYGFELPEPYRSLRDAGHLDAPPSQNHLAFYDCEWLSLRAIAEYSFNEWEITGDGMFVPFAITGRHEPYCWRLDWESGAEPPIVLCERCESGICLAPDFRGFLYRMALEAFAGRNDFLGEAKVEELHQTVNILASLLPAHWAQQLRDLRGRPWQKDEKRGCLFILPQPECDAIIAAELTFPHLNEVFIHDKEYLKRQKQGD